MIDGPAANLPDITGAKERGRVGYLILAHKFPLQVEALVRLIRAQSDNPIFVHVDWKSRRIFQEMPKRLGILKDVVVSSRHAIRWGGYSMVTATIDCANRTFQAFPEITHIKLMSGLDFPVRNLADFEAFVHVSGRHSIIDYHPLPRPGLAHQGGMSQIEYPHLVIGKNRFLRLPLRRRVPAGKVIYHGSQFWCLSKGHFEALQLNMDRNRRLFRWSLIPDEMYFQTVLNEMLQGRELINLELTYTRWGPKGEGPFVLSQADLEIARELGYFFARKVFIPVENHEYSAENEKE